MVDYPAIGDIDDPSQVRVALIQNKQVVHVALNGLGLQPAGSYQPLDADLTSWALITRGTGFDTFAASIIGTSGYVVQSVTATYATNAALTTTIPADDTTPLISEGTEILSVSITPKTTTNKLRCRFSGFGAASATLNVVAALYQGSTCIDALYISATANVGLLFALEAEYTPGVTTAQTISVRVGPGTAGTVRMNGTSAARIFGGASNADLVVEEIKA